MRYEVKISAQAENDLRGIYLYIARELKSPQNALRQFERLENNIYSLDELPERYRCYERTKEYYGSNPDIDRARSAQMRLPPY